MADNASHAFTRPRTGRPVYDSPLGDVLYDEVGDELWIDCRNRVVARCRPSEGAVVVSVRQSALRDLWLLSRPLFTLPLIELLKRRGRYSLHAAGVATSGRGLVMAGSTGSGKSTLALAMLRAGFSFQADDMLFLDSADGKVRMLAFPDEIDVTETTAGFFSELACIADRAPDPGWPKHRLSATELYGTTITVEAVPTAAVFPRIVEGAASSLEPMSADEALFELAPNVLLTQPFASQAHLDALGSLARQTRCVRLHAGQDLVAVARLLSELVLSDQN